MSGMRAMHCVSLLSNDTCPLLILLALSNFILICFSLFVGAHTWQHTHSHVRSPTVKPIAASLVTRPKQRETRPIAAQWRRRRTRWRWQCHRLCGWQQLRSQQFGNAITTASSNDHWWITAGPTEFSATPNQRFNVIALTEGSDAAKRRPHIDEPTAIGHNASKCRFIIVVQASSPARMDFYWTIDMVNLHLFVILTFFLQTEEIQKRREASLRQHAFFQLRAHLICGNNLLAMDKNGLCAHKYNNIQITWPFINVHKCFSILSVTAFRHQRSVCQIQNERSPVAQIKNSASRFESHLGWNIFGAHRRSISSDSNQSIWLWLGPSRRFHGCG